MIDSELIIDILDFTLESEECVEQLTNQMEFLSIKEEEYTETGLFVHFNHAEGIEKFRIETDGKNLNVDGKSTYRIEKLELINKHINIQADTCVHLTDGLIDCVEIWNKVGSYPKAELVTYELKRL
jgi:hypothetical protein